MLAVDPINPPAGSAFPKPPTCAPWTTSETTTPADVDWVQHYDLRTPRQAQAANRRNAKNIKDQHNSAPPNETTPMLRTWPTTRRNIGLRQRTLLTPTRPSANSTRHHHRRRRAASSGSVEDAVQTDPPKNSIPRPSRSAATEDPTRCCGRPSNPGSETKGSQLDQFRNPPPPCTPAGPASCHLTSDDCGKLHREPASSQPETPTGPASSMHRPRMAPPAVTATPGLAIVGEPGSGKSNPRQALLPSNSALRRGHLRIFDPGKQPNGQSVPLRARSAGH